MKRFGLPLFCLLVSIVIWIQVASTTILSDTVDLPLEVTGLRAGLTAAGNTLPEKVTVRLQGSKLQLMAHRLFRRPYGRATLDLARKQAGDAVQQEITVANVHTDLTALAVTPPVNVSVLVDREETRRLPVSVTTVGELPADRALLRPLSAEPDSVLVSGPARVLRAHLALRTEPIELNRLRASADLPRRLVSPVAGLRLAVAEARVSVALAPRESRTFSHVLVVPRGEAQRPVARIDPPRATLVVSGPADSLEALDPDRLAVRVPVSGLAAASQQVAGQAVVPGCCRVETMSPDEFLVHLAAGRGE